MLASFYIFNPIYKYKIGTKGYSAAFTKMVAKLYFAQKTVVRRVCHMHRHLVLTVSAIHMSQLHIILSCHVVELYVCLV
jgi:hypothetical protein